MSMISKSVLAAKLVARVALHEAFFLGASLAAFDFALDNAQGPGQIFLFR